MLQSHVDLFLSEQSECLEAKARTEYCDSVTFQQADFCPWSHPMRPSQLPGDLFYLPSPSPPASDRSQTGHAHPSRCCPNDSCPNFWPDFQGNANVFVASQVIWLLLFAFPFYAYFSVFFVRCCEVQLRSLGLPRQWPCQRRTRLRDAVLGTHTGSWCPRLPQFTCMVPFSTPNSSDLLSKSHIFIQLPLGNQQQTGNEKKKPHRIMKHCAAV